MYTKSVFSFESAFVIMSDVVAYNKKVLAFYFEQQTMVEKLNGDKIYCYNQLRESKPFTAREIETIEAIGLAMQNTVDARRAAYQSVFQKIYEAIEDHVYYKFVDDDTMTEILKDIGTTLQLFKDNKVPNIQFLATKKREMIDEKMFPWIMTNPLHDFIFNNFTGMVTPTSKAGMRLAVNEPKDA